MGTGKGRKKCGGGRGRKNPPAVFFEPMESATIRCPRCGHFLAALEEIQGEMKILVRCADSKCRSWARIESCEGRTRIELVARKAAQTA